jgi:enoyl-[acyl-carrier protein] reductase III
VRDDLASQTALVTGGTRGIGAAIARALAARGCRLLLNYRDRDKPAQAIRDELVARGAAVTLVRADLTDAARRQELFDAIRRAADRLDILVHSAGSMMLRHAVVDTNPRAVVQVSQHIRGLMPRGGRFVVVTDESNVDLTPASGPLAAFRDAPETLVRFLSVQLAREGIVVKGVRSLAAEARAPGDVGTVVAKLCLPGASSIGGQIATAVGPACPRRR